MSGSLNNTTKPGVPLSSLPSVDKPQPTDLVFVIFDGKGQFVPQDKVWTGAVDKIAGQVMQKVGGQVSAAETSAQAAELSATNANNAASGAANAARTAINAQKGAVNGVVAISANGHLMLDGQELFGVQDGHLIFVLPLPTSDPGIANAWWNNGGTIYISQG